LTKRNRLIIAGGYFAYWQASYLGWGFEVKSKEMLAQGALRGAVGT
jgi:hypothetical protein